MARFIVSRLQTSKRDIWDEEKRTRIFNLAEEQADSYGKDLDTADDGAPWFSLPELKPPNWNWNTAAQFFTECAERMRINCNRHWRQLDDAETIYAEVMIQWFSQERPDLFRLPLVLNLHYPNRMSVGHDKHGQGMFSGWPLRPTAMDQRDAEANNMLIESWTSNSFKWDMDKRYYAPAIEILKAVHIPKVHYDSSLPAPKKVEGAPKLPEIDYDDDEDFEDICEGDEIADNDEEDEEDEEIEPRQSKVIIGSSKAHSSA